MHRQGDLQLFPTNVYFVKRKSTNQNRENPKLYGISSRRQSKKECYFAEQICTEMNDISQKIIGLCSKDLISCEAKYHATCYKNFVHQLKKSKSSGLENDNKMTFMIGCSNFVLILLNPQE